MHQEEKAKELIHRMGVANARICVEEIISALKTTIDHCTLNKLDYSECRDDISYWESVGTKILYSKISLV